jgi:hypothetical protein
MASRRALSPHSSRQDIPHLWDMPHRCGHLLWNSRRRNHARTCTPRRKSSSAHKLKLVKYVHSGLSFYVWGYFCMFAPIGTSIVVMCESHHVRKDAGRKRNACSSDNSLVRQTWRNMLSCARPHLHIISRRHLPPLHARTLQHCVSHESVGSGTIQRKRTSSNLNSSMGLGHSFTVSKDFLDKGLTLDTITSDRCSWCKGELGKSDRRV